MNAHSNHGGAGGGAGNGVSRNIGGETDRVTGGGSGMIGGKKHPKIARTGSLARGLGGKKRGLGFGGGRSAHLGGNGNGGAGEGGGASGKGISSLTAHAAGASAKGSEGGGGGGGGVVHATVDHAGEGALPPIMGILGNGTRIAGGAVEGGGEKVGVSNGGEEAAGEGYGGVHGGNAGGGGGGGKYGWKAIGQGQRGLKAASKKKKKTRGYYDGGGMRMKYHGIAGGGGVVGNNNGNGPGGTKVTPGCVGGEWTEIGFSDLLPGLNRISYPDSIWTRLVVVEFVPLVSSYLTNTLALRRRDALGASTSNSVPSHPPCLICTRSLIHNEALLFAACRKALSSFFHIFS